MSTVGVSESSTRALIVAGSAAFLGSLDSALNIAFPDVTSYFEIDVAAIRWLVISYVLTYAIVLPAAGRIADRLGHGRMLVQGLVVSTVAFVATGLAQTYGILLVARMIQGVGAAMILGAAPALVTLSIAESRRGQALGLFQMSAAAGLAAGPLLGGILVGGFGWRAVFLFRVPVALVVLGIAWSSRISDRKQPTGPSSAAGSSDAAGVGGHGDGGGGDLQRLLKHPPFVAANALNLISHAAMFAIWLLVPYYAINVLETGAVAGGLLLTVAPLATALSAPAAGWLADRFGAAVLSSSGLALEAVALGLLSRLDAQSSVVPVAGALALVGVSISIFGVPNMRYVMGSIGPDHQGVAGSTVQAMRTAGIVIGVFVASAWFEAQRSEAARDLGVAVDGPISFVPAFRSTLSVATLVAAGALIASLVRGRTRPGSFIHDRR